VLAFCSRCRLA